MVKSKKDNDKESNTGTLGVINNYAGQFFSLNMEMSSNFGVGQREDGSKKIWLSVSNWFDQAPNDLSNEEVNTVAKSLKIGTIVVGKRWLPALKKDNEVKAQYLSLIRTAPSCNEEFKNKIRTLVGYQAHGNFTAKEILLDMIKLEKDGLARQPFLVFLNSGLDNCKGPDSLVSDYPDDPDNFTVEMDMSTMKVISTTKKRSGQKDSFKEIADKK